MAEIIALSSFCICLQLSLYIFILLVTGEVKAAGLSSLRIDRSVFPKDFKFGAATSAYQVVPSSPSIWIHFNFRLSICQWSKYF
jgi:hypothetical protein